MGEAGGSSDAMDAMDVSDAAPAASDASAAAGPGALKGAAGEGSGQQQKGGNARPAESFRTRETRVLEKWRARFPSESDEGIQLLHLLMRYKPDERLAASDALEHAYCNAFHDADYAVNATKLVHTSGIPDNEKRSVKEYREKLYEACKTFGPKGETEREGGSSSIGQKAKRSHRESRRKDDRSHRG